MYGDTAGGFGVLKDVPKILVYELSKYRNTLSEVIPERIIERPPSAELAPNQQDSDSLPDYDVLDKIIELYVEQDKSKTEIVSEGFDESIVKRVIRLIDISEYKRRQAPLGVKITSRGFGKDRRYRITKWYSQKQTKTYWLIFYYFESLFILIPLAIEEPIKPQPIIQTFPNII